MGRRIETILKSWCVQDREVTFNNKYMYASRRMCCNCSLWRIDAEYKSQWQNLGAHHHVKQDHVSNLIRCVRCNRRMSNIRPAVACVDCIKAIQQHSDEELESLDEGALMPSEYYEIIELETRDRNSRN